ncbi:MAG: hypothetical protein Tsb009_15210 [Planctomycetaceae bacterium]
MDLGEMDIWDGADLSLLRDTLTELIEDQGCRSIGVNLQYVKYIPSGFFGMLSDWHDKGVAMYVYQPQENVAKMLWFRRFFNEISAGCYELKTDQKDAYITADETEWVESDEWGQEQADNIPASSR